MTWIVGKALPFGFAAAVSDIRVTTPAGEKDCLQKIYKVGNYMAIGFAGTVMIGFKMVDQLRRELAAPGPDLAWIPERVADQWPAVARVIFEEEAPVYNDPTCELILMSAHPTEDIGIGGMAKCYVHRFRYPDFEPELAPAGGLTPGESDAVAIGSGNTVEDFRKALQDAGQYPFQVTGPIMHLQDWDPTIAASVLVGDIRHAIYNQADRGVSPLLQLCLVSRGGVRIVNANTTRYGQNSVEDFTVPALARTDAELAIALADVGGIANARC